MKHLENVEFELNIEWVQLVKNNEYVTTLKCIK